MGMEVLTMTRVICLSVNGNMLGFVLYFFLAWLVHDATVERAGLPITNPNRHYADPNKVRQRELRLAYILL